jgi:hypothetical protein
LRAISDDVQSVDLERSIGDAMAQAQDAGWKDRKSVV